MKKYFLILLFAVSIYPQSSKLLLLMGDDNLPSPSEIDPDNLLALYDGDTELTASAWGDQSGNDYDITFYNEPTVVPNAVNGHQVIRFNGTDEYGNRETTPALTQPRTIYIVFKQVTWTNTERIFSADNQDKWILYQNNVTPDLSFYIGGVMNDDPNISVGDYGIMTIVANGASSEMRTNDSPAVAGNVSTGNSTGITLAAQNDGSTRFGNIEIAYLVIRTGADDTATQDQFIEWFKKRFGL